MRSMQAFEINQNRISAQIVLFSVSFQENVESSIHKYIKLMPMKKKIIRIFSAGERIEVAIFLYIQGDAY